MLCTIPVIVYVWILCEDGFREPQPAVCRNVSPPFHVAVRARFQPSVWCPGAAAMISEHLNTTF